MKKLVAVYALAAGIMIEVGAMGAGIELAKLDNENIDLYGIEQTAADTDRPVIVAQRRSVQEGTDELMRNAFLDRGLALFGGLLIGAGAGVLLKW